MKLAAFIVNKRKAFIVLFALACIYSAISISKVGVINHGDQAGTGYHERRIHHLRFSNCAGQQHYL